MKNFTLPFITLLVLFFLSSGANAQDGKTFSDNFSTSIDYLSSGVAGTIWEGILLNNNLWSAGETVAEITKLNTTEAAGALTFATMNSNWAVGSDWGAALYRTVKNGADFEAQVKIIDGQYISLGYDRCDYLMSGIIARVKGDTTFLLIQAFDVSAWNAVIGMRDIIPAEGLAQENWPAPFDGFTVANYPYQKLEKYENTFTGYYSADGVVWEEIYSVEKPQFAGKDIQVGLYTATYTANEGRVVFDDFVMVDYNDFSAVDNLKTPNQMKAHYTTNTVNVMMKDNSSIQSIKIYGIDGSVKFKSLNVNSSTLSVPFNQKGLFVVVCESGGRQYSRKILAN